jgi:hypothetical protein
VISNPVFIGENISLRLLYMDDWYSTFKAKPSKYEQSQDHPGYSCPATILMSDDNDDPY